MLNKKGVLEMKRTFIFVMTALLIIATGTPITAAALPDENNGIKITHSIINEKDDYCDIKVITPYFEDFSEADELNHHIRNKIINAIGEVRSSCIALKEYDRTTELNISYEYTKYENLISMKFITYTYLGGAHGRTIIESITANTKNNMIYPYRDIFINEEEGTDFVKKYVLESIKTEPDGYFENYKKTIEDKSDNFDFYLEGDNLIIYFGQYEISPYAAGIRYFSINAANLKGILKDEIYEVLAVGHKKSNINYNGTDIKSDLKVLKNNNGIDYVPLRIIAETLGYEVGWNKDDGAIIAGGHIKEGSNKYWKEGKDPVELTEPFIVDNVTYVPIDYFANVLEENVSFGYLDNENLTIKIFSKNKAESNFDRLIKGFYFPFSGENAVKMYAEAVKNRNGAIQYALYSDKLKAIKYKDFSSFYFVTGVSSPWVDSYEITKIDDNQFDIEFTYITSVPTDLFKHAVKITVGENNGYWYITSLE